MYWPHKFKLSKLYLWIVISTCCAVVSWVFVMNTGQGHALFKRRQACLFSLIMRPVACSVVDLMPGCWMWCCCWLGNSGQALYSWKETEGGMGVCSSSLHVDLEKAYVCWGAAKASAEVVTQATCSLYNASGELLPQQGRFFFSFLSFFLHVFSSAEAVSHQWLYLQFSLELSQHSAEECGIEILLFDVLEFCGFHWTMNSSTKYWYKTALRGQCASTDGQIAFETLCSHTFLLSDRGHLPGETVWKCSPLTWRVSCLTSFSDSRHITPSHNVAVWNDIFQQHCQDIAFYEYFCSYRQSENARRDNHPGLSLIVTSSSFFLYISVFHLSIRLFPLLDLAFQLANDDSQGLNHIENSKPDNDPTWII